MNPMTRWTARAAAIFAAVICALSIWAAAPDRSRDAVAALREACREIAYTQARAAPTLFGSVDLDARLAACRRLSPAWDRATLRDGLAAGGFAVLLMVLMARREERH